jgi:predicted membrane protein DUF2157
MNPNIFKKLHSEGLLSDESFGKIKLQISERTISVHWELRTILYIGILLLTSGLGILVYKNIDTISHQAVLLFIALISATGFYYCFKNKLPFSSKKVDAPNSFFDYVLLLANLCFIIVIGYWQYQFRVFGDKFGLATFIPMTVLFFSAYFFDHLGILSLAITNLAAWLGIVVTPIQILKANNFNSSDMIITGLLLGVGLLLAGKLTIIRKIKPHFEWMYTNFGMHIIFISCIGGLFHFDAVYLLWFLALLAVAFYFYSEAKKRNSFYFLLMLTLYCYIGLSYVVIHFLFSTVREDMSSAYLVSIYFIGSAIGLILFLIKMNKKLKSV